MKRPTNMTRRGARAGLARGATLPLAGLAMLGASRVASAADAICADPAKLDSGQMLAIVQEADETFRPGDRVRILSDGATSRVTR